MLPLVVICVLVGCAASIEDLAHRQVSNWISLSAAVAGFACSFWRRGWAGLGMSGLGMAIGFAAFLLFYLLGGMGGGDVKLMAGFGALLGPHAALTAAFLAALLGAVLAAIVWIAARFRGRKVRAIPYAPVISLGAWMALTVA